MNNIFKASLIIGIVAGTLWFVQYSIQKVLDISGQPIVAQKLGHSSNDTEQIVTSAFQASGVTPPTSGESERYASSDIQQQILELLKTMEVEIYVLNREDTVSWRIYNKDALQYQIAFSDTKAPITIQSDKEVHTLTRKDPVALLLTGTKYKDLEPLFNLDIPLNLALEPTSPFALRNAVMGARKWHEIVLDIRNSSEFVLDTLPFATTLLSTSDLPIETMHVLTTAETQLITTSISDLPNGKIWRLNMTHLSTQDVEQWLKSLPDSIQFVRLSYWDIVPQ